MADAAAKHEPIRSKYRGLSWDKKFSGWRVRVYYAGKQRHVGRYEDEIAAAQAYDKAVVCLYGEYAVTNFGLEACLKDPTEVSVFILQAKEKAQQEQPARAQQQQLQHQQHRPSNNGSTASSAQLQPVLRHGMVLSPQGMVLSPQGITCQQHAQQQLPVPRQQLPAVDYAVLQQQLQSAGAMAFTKDCLQTQLASSRGLAGSQQSMFSAVDPSSYVLMSSPLSHSISDASCATGATNHLSNSGGLSSSNDTVSSSYMLCSTPSSQNVVLPVVRPAPAVSACSTQDASFASPAQLQVQQQQPQHLQQHQLHQRQQQLQLPQHLQSPPPQQQQQQFALFGQGQPLQLSVQPELTTIAGHMSSAAEAAGVEQQQQFLQHLMGLTLLEPAAPSSPDMFQMKHAASGSNPQLPTAMQQDMQHYHPQLQANAMIHGTVMGLSPNSSTGLMPGSSVPCCAPVLDGSMSWGLQQCGVAFPGAITTAAAGVVSAVISHQQQQELPVVLAVQGNSCTSAFQCTSSSCSPMTLASM